MSCLFLSSYFFLIFFEFRLTNSFVFTNKRLEEFKIWSLKEMVKNFRLLSNNKLAFLQTGFLKPKKFKEYQEKV